MKTRLILAWALSLPGLLFGADAADAAKRWEQYEPSFKAFAEADVANPPNKGGILFVGSSIFRQWASVADDMAPLPVLNRAFGGSRTADQLAHFAQVVPPYAPKVIVYYCGSNDLKAAAPEDPATIFSRVRQFSERVQQVQPGTRLIYVSSTRSPDRVSRWEQVDHFNALVRAYCAATPYHTYVDVNPALIDHNGHPRLDLYKDDKLHFHPPSYAHFTAVIKPVLHRVWNEVSAAAVGSR